MWCTDCRQDVPGIRDHERPASINCGRCGAPLERDVFSGLTPEAVTIPPPALESSALPLAAPPNCPDVDWQIEADLQAAARILQFQKHHVAIAKRTLSGGTGPPTDTQLSSSTAVREPGPTLQTASHEGGFQRGRRRWTLSAVCGASLIALAVLLGCLAVRSGLTVYWQAGLIAWLIGQMLLLISFSRTGRAPSANMQPVYALSHRPRHHEACTAHAANYTVA